METFQATHTPTVQPSPTETQPPALAATAVVAPTATAVPTFTPLPKPSATPRPTATPYVTSTPQPTPTPAQDVGVNDMILNFFYDEVNAGAKYAIPFVVSGRIERISEEGLDLAGGYGDRVVAEIINREALASLARNGSVSLYCQHADGTSGSVGASIRLKECKIIIDSPVTPVPPATTTTTLEVSLGDMLSDYVDNEIRADTKYSESFIVSAATVIETRGSKLVLMEGSSYNVVANIPDEEDLQDIGYGDRIALWCEGAEGNADGLPVSIRLKECTLIPPEN